MSHNHNTFTSERKNRSYAYNLQPELSEYLDLDESAHSFDEEVRSYFMDESNGPKKPKRDRHELKLNREEVLLLKRFYEESLPSGLSTNGIKIGKGRPQNINKMNMRSSNKKRDLVSSLKKGVRSSRKKKVRIIGKQHDSLTNRQVLTERKYNNKSNLVRRDKSNGGEFRYKVSWSELNENNPFSPRQQFS